MVCASKWSLCIFTDWLQTVGLPAAFSVWLSSPEANFLESKFVWANWDVEELKSRAEEIRGSKVLTIMLEGVPM